MLWLDYENGLSRLRNCHSKARGTASGVTHSYALEEALQASGKIDVMRMKRTKTQSS